MHSIGGRRSRILDLSKEEEELSKEEEYEAMHMGMTIFFKKYVNK
jgi:hypothetical protein